MSQYFQIGDLVLWNPSNRVAQLFVHMTEAMVAVVECPSGMSANGEADEYEIDPKTFAAFVNALTAQYLSTTHPILTTMVEGYLPAALVLVQRSGYDVPALKQSIAHDSRDISLHHNPFDPDSARRHLVELAEHHARAMPR